MKISHIADMANHTIDHWIITLSGKLGIGGTVTAVGSGAAGKLAESVAANPQVAENVIQWSTVGVQSGIFLGFMGFAVQAYYQRKRNKREEVEAAQREEMHRLQKAVLEEQLGIKYHQGGQK